MVLVSTTRIIPGRAVPSFLSGRYSAVKVRKKLYVTPRREERAYAGDSEAQVRRGERVGLPPLPGRDAAGRVTVPGGGPMGLSESAQES